jgi:hypothetical protein
MINHARGSDVTQLFPHMYTSHASASIQRSSLITAHLIIKNVRRSERSLQGSESVFENREVIAR